MRLNKGLQDLGHFALVGKTIRGDDLGTQALQADVPITGRQNYFMKRIISKAMPF